MPSAHSLVAADSMVELEVVDIVVESVVAVVADSTVWEEFVVASAGSTVHHSFRRTFGRKQLAHYS